jgi:hypothetical protein
VAEAAGLFFVFGLVDKLAILGYDSAVCADRHKGIKKRDEGVIKWFGIRFC